MVDDDSPDGTGRLADSLAAADPRIAVCHRAVKAGLGPAYLEGFSVALAGGAERIVQMDADWSHDPAYLPALVGALDRADLAIGSRYVAGGGVRDWGVAAAAHLARRVALRADRPEPPPARPDRGLQGLAGGHAAAACRARGSTPAGYVFQIEMTYLASRLGARIVEVPIVFSDRRVGVSKMSRGIVREAFVVVLRLRWDEVRGRGALAAARARADADPG